MNKIFEFDQHIGDWRVLIQAKDIRNGVIEGKHIAPGAVTTDKLAPEAVADLSGATDVAEQAAAAASHAAEAAAEQAQHPIFVGDDYYVYRWDSDIKDYVKTDVYVKGDLSESDIMSSEEAQVLFNSIFN